ncbi:MAG: glutaminyl-peptide cyclotransferase, partial [Pirellulaceae bacterium]
DDLFGEGITIFNDRIYQLTWKAKTGFVYLNAAPLTTWLPSQIFRGLPIIFDEVGKHFLATLADF